MKSIKILEVYPKLNANWFLKEKGNMIRCEKPAREKFADDDFLAIESGRTKSPGNFR